MRIGVPKEIKPQENRIGLTPDSVKTLVSEGHEVLVENNGGFEAGFDNDQYKNAGAKIIEKAADIFNDAEIIVKVKEPQKVEVEMIRENQIVYTYLHLAAAKELTEGLVKSKSINIAYETITDDNGRLPLLAPMSAVAGRMSVQAGAHCLEKNQKGRGVLLGGAPGGEPANVLILGGGVVGENAATIATGMKAKVHVVDKSEARLKQLVEMFGDKIIPEQSDKIDLKKLVAEADLIVGGVEFPGENDFNIGDQAMYDGKQQNYKISSKELEFNLSGKSKKRTLYEALLKMIPYLESHLQKGGKASSVLRHLINSVSGLEGAKLFRSTLSENMNKKNQPEIFEKALKLVNFTDKKTDVEGTQFESGLV